MKNLLIAFLILTMTSLAQNEDTTNCSIYKNGIYHSPIDSISNIYIRFTGSNSVFTTSSDIDYDLASKYIVPANHKYLMTGKYLINERDCLVKIKAKNEYGKVEMEGIISDNRLILTVVNKSDNTAKDFIFDFYPEN
jgi:hypothetical protein